MRQKFFIGFINRISITSLEKFIRFYKLCCQLSYQHKFDATFYGFGRVKITMPELKVFKYIENKILFCGTLSEVIMNIAALIMLGNSEISELHLYLHFFSILIAYK